MPLGTERAEQPRRLRPERAGSLLPALADEPDLVGRRELEVLDAQVEEFLDTRPGIEQRGQRGVVPAASVLRDVLRDVVSQVELLGAQDAP